MPNPSPRLAHPRGERQKVEVDLSSRWLLRISGIRGLGYGEACYTALRAVTGAASTPQPKETKDGS
jgi:hypothetical protein